jgi:hypothetical protein
VNGGIRNTTGTKANTAAFCGNRHQRFFWAKESEMGWYGSEHEDKKSFVQEILANMGERVVDHAVVGNHLWTLYRDDEFERLVIGLDLLRKHDGCWFNKSMCEYMHPYYYDCPLRLIRAADEPVSETATEWRKAVEKWHEEKVQARKRAAQLAPGMVVVFGSHLLKLIEPLGGRRGWIAMDIVNPQKLWRLTAKQAGRARVIQQPCQESSDSVAGE